MVGVAVQFGALAACIVLFVPMGLAGLHLSRNKMLFFSGVLFITLAVGVHLTPYFPSITSVISSLSSSSSSSSVVVLDNHDSCISFLHEIVWDVKKQNTEEQQQQPTFMMMKNNNSLMMNDEVSWTWVESTPVIACGFQKLGRSDASDLLNGSWIVVAGDSQARLFVLSLLNLILEPREMELVRGDLFKRHSNYQTVISGIGVKLDFVWAPYTSNLTDLLVEFKHLRRHPDVLVMGSGLWDMLHITNATEYGESLEMVKRSLVSLLSVSPELGNDDGPVTGSITLQSPHMFWLGMPTLVDLMLNTDEKREKMNAATRKAYEREVYESKILRQSGGPLLLLNIRSLSESCGAECTIDGMHYDGAVYEASVHVMLNALLIESQQRL